MADRLGGKGNDGVAALVLLHTVQDKPEQAKETLKFFEWSFKNRTSAADSLDYISLPQSVVGEIRSQWKVKVKVKDATGKPVAPSSRCASPEAREGVSGEDGHAQSDVAGRSDVSCRACQLVR